MPNSPMVTAAEEFHPPNDSTAKGMNSMWERSLGAALAEIIQSGQATLRHVPKGVRDLWSSLLQEEMLAVVDNLSSVDCWGRLFMLPKCILSRPLHHSARWSKSRRLVKAKIRQWRAGKLEELWADACQYAGKSAHRRRHMAVMLWPPPR